ARGNACPSTNCTSSPWSASGTSGSHPSPRTRNAPSLGLAAPATHPLTHDPVTVQATPSPGRLEAGCAPECEPALEVLLHRELVGEGVAELDLEEAVAGLRAAGSKGVEGALLVEIDEPDVAAGGVVERHQRAQQPGREALFLQRGVDRVQVGAESLDVVVDAVDHQPGEAEVVAVHLDVGLVGVVTQERDHLVLRLLVRRAL